MRTAKEKLEENEFDSEEVILLDEEAFRECLIGVSHDMRAIYDYDLMAQEYAKYHDVTLWDAMEHIDYNVIRSLPYMGEKSPIVMDSLRL